MRVVVIIYFMSELGVQAQKYFETATAIGIAEELKAQGGPPETYEAEIARKEAILSLLEANGVADQFIDFVLNQPVEDPDVALQRATLESLREDKSYQELVRDGIIAESDLEAKIAELPAPPEASPEMEFAQEYVAGLAFWAGINAESTKRNTPEKVKPVPRSQTEQEQEPVPETKAETSTEPRPVDNTEVGETNAEFVNIWHFKGDNVLLIDCDHYLPLARSTESAQQTAEQEATLEDYRVEVLRFLGKNPDDEFQSTEIWARIDPNGDKIRAGWWNSFMADFIESVELKGEKLISVRKGNDNPKSKRRYYKANRPIKIEELDEESGQEFLTNFKLPNGRVIGARAGKIAHLLTRASEESPVTLEVLKEHGIFVDPDTTTKRTQDHYLSGVVSSIRGEIRADNSENSLIVHRVLLGEKLGAGRRESAYWIEQLTEEELIEMIQVKKVVNFIDSKRSELRKAGLPIIGEDAVSRVKAYPDSLKGDKKHTQQELQNALIEIYKYISELGDNIFDMPETDARWKLVEYFYDSVLLDSAETKTAFKAVMGIDSNVNGNGRAVKPESELQTLSRQARLFVVDLVDELRSTGVMKDATSSIHISKLPGHNIPKEIKTKAGNIAPMDVIELALKNDRRFTHVFQGGHKAKIKQVLNAAKAELTRQFEQE